jgi:hypothetical protein
MMVKLKQWHKLDDFDKLLSAEDTMEGTSRSLSYPPII